MSGIEIRLLQKEKKIPLFFCPRFNRKKKLLMTFLLSSSSSGIVSTITIYCQMMIIRMRKVKMSL